MPNKKKIPVDKKQLMKTIIISFLGFVVLLMSASFISRIFSNPSAAAAVTDLSIQETIKPEITKIQILNASGVEGLAKKVKDFLTSKGYFISDVGNYSGAVDKTFLIDRSGDTQVSGKIADALGIDRKLIKAETGNVQIVFNTVVIGNDFSALKPFK
jgi:hypothetical protein